jgi:hypothetical protein
MGSMDEKALALVLNETQAALDDGVINEVVVVYGDRVTKIETYHTGEDMEFDPRGGGGTTVPCSNTSGTTSMIRP